MHIAICDDNVADRKQLERLLKREADKRAVELNGFYVDSYGNTTALMRSPMLYDAFFIDMCLGEDTGIDVCKKLIDCGVSAPIILCSSLIPYQEYSLPTNVLFLDKPIQTAALSQMLDYCAAIKQDRIPHIELREESGQYHYVTESDILYAIANGNYIKVTLTNKKVLSVLSTLDNLYSQLERYPSLFTLNRKVLINGRYLEHIHLFTATMTDGTAFRISAGNLAYAKYALEKFQPETVISPKA